MKHVNNLKEYWNNHGEAQSNSISLKGTTMSKREKKVKMRQIPRE